MADTSKILRQVLCSWLATEVLTPQTVKDGWGGLAVEKSGQQRNKASATPDGSAHWEMPGDDDATPWPLLPERLNSDARFPDPAEKHAAATPDQERRWYYVVLGALPARLAFKRLDAAFSDHADDDETNRRSRGNIIGATVVLDEWGVLVADTLAIASFAWGLGHILSGGSVTALATWDEQEQDLRERFGGLLAPAGPGGRFRSLTWRDVRGVSSALAVEFGLPTELWAVTPCAIEVVSKHPPAADILSSFYLPDLKHVLREADHLPDAAAAYLGLRPPEQPWNPLSDCRRPQLSSLLQPALFPLGRWPGPGLHPLTLLQQAAVNTIVRDLDQAGLAAVNGPPGTGKTTLLRDLVAHVLVSRAEVLAGLDKPWADLSGLNLMDFAVVVASSNNAAVENVSLELPLRAKALDKSVWHENGLDYFGHTASAVSGVLDKPADQRAWGLMAARLGKAENRRDFFQRFWWNHDWGLNDWLDRVGWPDVKRPWREPPGKLVQLDPPPRRPEATANWRTARDAFRQALDHCRKLRAKLETLNIDGALLRETEAQLPAAASRLRVAVQDLASVTRAVEKARRDVEDNRGRDATEAAKLAALASVAPSRLMKLFRTRAWQVHEAEIRMQLAKLDKAQATTRAAEQRLAEAVAEADRYASECQTVRAMHDDLCQRADNLAQSLRHAQSEMGVAAPGPGFWKQPDDDLQRTGPWNEGMFRAARDDLFIAAVRLHKAFIVAAARKVKPALKTIAEAVQGGPGAPRPSAADWGIFFLTVPVVSTTFASVGRMFQGFGAGEIGWMMIDEAGQATPQAAVGAIWRARRAVVIGDPLQIEPVVTTPPHTTRLVFEGNGADPANWAAPEQSAQTLADRASRIQGRFGVENGEAGREVRITGIPLLVHRRCERPMFDIANRIAYDGRMVFAAKEAASPIRDLLGCSAWIDVDAPSMDKWVEAEGKLITAAITRLSDALQAPPDIYVICPFKMPAQRLRAMLRNTPGALAGLPTSERRTWIDKRVGTVHTFQGKEAEAVILMLGAGSGAKTGSRVWAGRTPNLLNVAATRAKCVLYIVGNRTEWQSAGVFADPAAHLAVRSEWEWLSNEPPDGSSARQRTCLLGEQTA
ncbi:DEAD/DEAH box helicase [Rhodopila sp.]|uniref:DEAD/DEAH box helicase n=1 Tax=Rhodopila sp. TaxID=2480087 RepID=UPI003D0F86F8